MFFIKEVTNNMRNKGNFAQKQNRSGWILLAPAMILILTFSIYPALKALITSFQSGAGLNMTWAGLGNYTRILKDKIFIQSLLNCIVYLIIQVPIMLVLALVLASALNDRALKCRGLFRTAIFLPCATSLVSYAIIFRSLFATDGFVNTILMKIGVLDEAFNFLSNATAAKAIIILALVWRWTGYNMVFYLAGLQNIDYSVYEAARIDGATPFQIFTKITVPLLKPTILMTAIMSTNGTLQLFDESVNLTAGGPGTSTMTMSHYIYNQAFMGVPNFGYTSAMAFVILIMVAILAMIQLKVGEKDE